MVSIFPVVGDAERREISLTGFRRSLLYERTSFDRIKTLAADQPQTQTKVLAVWSVVPSFRKRDLRPVEPSDKPPDPVQIFSSTFTWGQVGKEKGETAQQSLYCGTGFVISVREPRPIHHRARRAAAGFQAVGDLTGIPLSDTRAAHTCCACPLLASGVLASIVPSIPSATV